jgi:hypothetical protein
VDPQTPTSNTRWIGLAAIAMLAAALAWVAFHSRPATVSTVASPSASAAPSVAAEDAPIPSTLPHPLSTAALSARLPAATSAAVPTPGVRAPRRAPAHTADDPLKIDIK